jgi:hypothetical protein
LKFLPYFTLSECRVEHKLYGDKLPRYATQLEKNIVLGVVNPSERVHNKWRKTLAKRKERDAQLQKRKDSIELIKVISSSVQACDRLVPVSRTYLLLNMIFCTIIQRYVNN